MEESAFPDLFHFLKSSSAELRHSPKVLTATEKQAHKEVIHLSRCQFGLACDITLPVPVPANPHDTGMGKVVEARMLLSQLGMFNESGYHRLYPISMSDALMSALDVLDNTWERETFSIAVVRCGCLKVVCLIYIFSCQCMMSNTKGVVVNGGASLEFMQFVLSLGWIITPSSHRCNIFLSFSSYFSSYFSLSSHLLPSSGYMGNADMNGVERSVYWANHRTELMFHVSPMLPSTRLVVDDVVAVLWIEEQPTYDFAVCFFFYLYFFF